MSLARVGKPAITALMAGYISMVFFNNIVDYPVNLTYLQHVMTMDSLPDASPHQWRSVQSPIFHHMSLLLIIVVQLLSALLCWQGVLKMLQINKHSTYADGKSAATLGLTLAMALWFGGFFIIGGEWFLAWQTKWGSLNGAIRVVTAIGITLIVIHLPEEQQGSDRFC